MRVCVSSYTGDIPAIYRAEFPAESRYLLGWPGRLSPTKMGPVTLWGGRRFGCLHNALTATLYNPGMSAECIEHRADVLQSTAAVTTPLWGSAQFCWGDDLLSITQWREHVLVPLVYEALDNDPELVTNLQAAALSDDEPVLVCLMQAGAAKWSNMTRTPLRRIFGDKRKTVTHAHAVAGYLIDDPYTNGCVRWDDA